METKFIQNEKSNYNYLLIAKLKMLMFFVIYKNKFRTNHNINIIIIMIAILFPNFIFSQSNNCNVTLNVVKNRNVKSVPSEGILYPMNITNNGVEKNTYSLSTSNNNECFNTDGSNSTNNVTLISELLDSNLNNIDEVSLNAGESKSFSVRITIPQGTPQGRWNCTEIIASSKNCSNYKISTVLHSLVMIPNSDN